LAQPPDATASRLGWLRHVPFAALVVFGGWLRWVDWRAYRPALLFPDSVHYLKTALSGSLDQLRPSGYAFAVMPFARLGDIELISLAQHLLVLALAVVLYAFLLRRSVPAWGAALASVPLLCDPLQLVLEQYVLSDVLYEMLLVIACLLLLWRHRPRLVDIVLAAALLGYAALVRGAGTGLIVPAVIALAALRVGWRRLLVAVVAFAVPVVVYMAAFDVQHGAWATNSYSSRYLYARVTTFVHCHRLHLPAYERPLCPSQPIAHRESSDWYMWKIKVSPQYTFTPPRGKTVAQVLRDFEKRVIRAQPVAYTRIVARDLLLGFSSSRRVQVPGFPAERWRFHRHYWSLDHGHASGHFIQLGFWPPALDRGDARFLTSYQAAFHTPGPLLLVAACFGALASAGIGRARRSGHRVACGLFVGVCMTSLLTTAALSGFSWRYQLPQLALLGPAAALAVTALCRRGRYALPAADSTLLRRLSAALRRRPASDPAVRRAEPFVAVVAAVLVGAGVAAAAVGSGWAEPRTAAVFGIVAAVVSAVLLLGSRWRGLPVPVVSDPSRSASP
jgi:hypothetical protein